MPNSVYPGTLITYTVKTNKVDLVDAAHINQLQYDVIAIATTLGVNPLGSAADLATRLLRNILADGSLNHGTSFPVSPNAGDWYFRTDQNVAYVYNGSSWTAQSGVTAYAAGTYLLAGPSSCLLGTGSGTSFAKVAEVYIPRSGTLTIKYRVFGSGHARIYRNGSAVGVDRSSAAEYSEDISGWSAGDLCQLYTYDSSTGSSGGGDMRVYENTPPREIASSSFQQPLAHWGNGAPDNAIGNQGDTYLRLDGGATTTFYVKTGASTWTAK